MRKVLLPLLGWGLVAVVAVGAWATTRTPATAQGDADAVERGGELYARNCASCHGARGGGGPGTAGSAPANASLADRSLGGGLRAGPPLEGIDVAYVDQQMRTGRMPLVDRSAGVVRDDAEPLPDAEREAIVAWMEAELELTGTIPRVGEGDASRGQELYTVHCAACHGSVGNGGISGSGVLVRELRGIDRVAIVEATRVGPYDMPAFDTDLISEEEADDIAAYADQELRAPSRTVLGLPEMNRVAMSGVAALLVLLVVGGVVLVTREVPMPTREEDQP